MRPKKGKAPINALDDTLARIAQLHPKSIDLSLGRVLRLLESLGRPQDKLPPVVHVAGTNGKGSTIAFIRAMAEANDKTCHVYTSPHLVHFAERIVVAGQQINDDALVALLERVMDVNAGAPITFFELTTAAALLAFSETPADYALIEVGLGGRFDATNVFAEPACTIITPVGMDHKEFLGDDLAKISWEKAGILKPGRPAIIGPQVGEARASIVTEAHVVGADLSVWGSDFRALAEHGRLVYECADAVLDLPAPALLGAHQVLNAGVAVDAARRLGLSEDAISKGITQARWPGRLQRLTDGPLVQTERGEDAEVWIDGAHNGLGAQALARAIADINDHAPRPLILVIGLQANKNAHDFLAPFAGLAGGVITVPLQSGAKSWDPDDLAALAAELVDAPTASVAQLSDAWRGAGRLLADEPHCRMLVCGSLHLVGEALALSSGAAPRATPG